MAEECDDGFGGVLDHLAEASSPFIKVGSKEPGYGFAILPRVEHAPEGSAEKRAIDDAWEQKSEAMHRDQPAAIKPPDKPMIRSLRGKRSIARGD